MSGTRLAETTTPQVEELDATDVEVAPPWMTVLHNCDCHTFEEVVTQLMKASLNAVAGEVGESEVPSVAPMLQSCC